MKKLKKLFLFSLAPITASVAAFSLSATVASNTSESELSSLKFLSNSDKDVYRKLIDQAQSDNDKKSILNEAKSVNTELLALSQITSEASLLTANVSNLIKTISESKVSSKYADLLSALYLINNANSAYNSIKGNKTTYNASNIARFTVEQTSFLSNLLELSNFELFETLQSDNASLNDSVAFLNTFKNKILLEHKFYANMLLGIATGQKAVFDLSVAVLKDQFPNLKENLEKTTYFIDSKKQLNSNADVENRLKVYDSLNVEDNGILNSINFNTSMAILNNKTLFDQAVRSSNSQNRYFLIITAVLLVSLVGFAIFINAKKRKMMQKREQETLQQLKADAQNLNKETSEETFLDETEVLPEEKAEKSLETKSEEKSEEKSDKTTEKKKNKARKS
ncbi:hypothetical protein [Mycoplasmopsis synoviae]|uniref:Uncharacterized protein n=1 Tax=Mycoplasmopsis synoviae TaxID=2109 RepID=A0A3B0P8H5_MYCSY|nr:hypothetical protein [Mycoplasmopsis synoviae]AKB11272.1 hypothetical protein VY93_02970 [Mycoplasmopsis synoviae ATCC 25204]UBX98537.1 hypothetical protein K6986_02175 [Mycoplasmopsis synoviae]SYV93448.1 Uncharacterised protein [Mycoplasmopsis synoviae]